MPPKRRKLSLDETDSSGREGKRQTVEAASSAEPDSKPSETQSEKQSDSGDKKSKPRASGESLSEIKAKDEAPKPTRISERLIIKRNRVGDSEEAENQNQNLTPSTSQTTPRKPRAARQTSKQQKKSKRRPWAQWSIRDKKLFFIGLGEYGKNFEAISNKISNAAKMRGHPLKDKMQVRYFYYRCWAKISKFVKLKGQDVSMKTKELYGLINYGVLRKHVKENDPQFGKYLNELIHNGETTYTAKNVRNKRMRVGKVRTPVCTYLKKLNKIEDKRKLAVAVSQKLPYQICLELTPKDSKTWAKVQAMSQNPRVRFKVTANRTVESVFKYLEKKWQPNRIRLKEKLKAPAEEADEELVFFLHPTCKVTPVEFFPQEQQKIDVTFTSFRENVLPTLPKPKKRASKEQDKSNEEKDKPNEEKQEESGVDGDSSEQCVTSTSKDSLNPSSSELNTDEPASAFANLLAAAATDMATFCKSDIASVAHTGGQNILADSPVGPTPPTVLLEDENAMFPDSPSFSPPPCTSALTSKPSVIPSSPSSSSSSLPTPSPSSTVIMSPSVSRKKSAKSKKSTAADEANVPADNCDNTGTSAIPDNSTSPAKQDASASLQELKDNSEKEITRLTTVVSEGLTKDISSTVTLLHLSLILGRESVIRLEYEWREKKPPKMQLPPLLSQAANQMSNVLRRLCNLAALELTEFSSASEKVVDQNKPPGKNAPCSLCGREGSARSRSKKQAQAERRESTREIATMTDPLRLEAPAMTSVFHPNTVIATGGGTFVAGPPPQGSMQVTSPDPLFRVPFVPTYKTVTSREEQQRLEEQQRVQQQARAIMQQAPTSRNRLLKKRTLALRNRKTPPIIVQRTLLPKVDSSQMVAYIQPGSQTVARSLVVGVTPDNLVKIAQPVGVNIVTTTTVSKSITQDQTKDARAGHMGNILALAAQSAEINANTIVSPEKICQSPVPVLCPSPAPSLSDVSEDTKPDEDELFPQLSVITTTTTTTTTVSTSSTCISSGMVSPALSSQGDISMSDFDISISSVTGSSLGPDAGDKFLDMVLQNSEQGFAGLIGTPKKSTQNSETYQPTLADTTASFDLSVLRTPPHVGIPSSSSTSTSSIYPSPLKLGISDQPWLSSECGDLSLSSILGDSSPFKKKDTEKSPEKSSPPSTSSYASFFDTSSDVPETSTMAFSKPSTISDLSLSSLLGDPSFKKDDPNGESPPIPVSSVATTLTRSNSAGDGGLFSDAVSLGGPPQLFSDASQDSLAKLDVDGALQGVVNESSLDFVSKFESLAAHISERQDQETVSGGDRQEKLLGGTGSVGHIIRFESPSTAS